VAVDVDLSEDLAVAAMDQHHQLRLRFDTARQVVVRGGDVGHIQILIQGDCRPADPDTYLDAGVLGRRADVRAEFERIAFEDIYANPIEMQAKFCSGAARLSRARPATPAMRALSPGYDPLFLYPELVTVT
jgi:hypothetical protein